MGTVRDTLAHADDAVKRGKSCWQISQVSMLMPELAQESHPRRHLHAAAKAMKPVQYAVTFSLLPTMDSSSQKKALWPVSFTPIVAYTRYNAADPMVVNKWVGTGCEKGQSFRSNKTKATHVYLRSSHAVQDNGLDHDLESREDVEIEETEYREPALGPDLSEGVLAGSVSVDHEGVVVAITAAAITVTLTRCWQMTTAVGHLDRPVHNDVQEGKDLGDDVEQAEIDATTAIGSLFRRRHEAE